MFFLAPTALAATIGADVEMGRSAEELELIEDAEDIASIKANTAALQAAVDAVSQAGGGTIILPAGTFCFFPQPQYGHNELHIIEYRSGVSITGAGQDATVLCPSGTTSMPVDMFYFAPYAETQTPEYLTDAHFSDFTIEGGHVSCPTTYNNRGKGFFFVLLRDCTWTNVTVKNTEATGFGVDCPIDCTFTNCTAVGCGRSAGSNSNGASGFGIGYGYSSDESVLIVNCVSEENRRFGFFFENQSRFSPELYTATPAVDSLVVTECTSRGNRFNYGGMDCEHALFSECVGGPFPLDKTPVYYPEGSLCDYWFWHSHDNRIVIDGEEMSAVRANKSYYTDIDWNGWFATGGWLDKCLDRGIILGYSTSTEGVYHKFGPKNKLTRAQAVTILFRASGDDVSEMLEEPRFRDVDPEAWYAEAVEWAAANGIVTGYGETGLFKPGNNISRQELACVMQRYAQLKGMASGAGTHASMRSYKDAGSIAQWARESMQWCLDNGIISGYGSTGYIKPRNMTTRAEGATIIIRTVELLERG